MCDLFGWSHILVHSETMFTRLLPGVAYVVMSYQCQMTCVHVCAYLSICYYTPMLVQYLMYKHQAEDRMPKGEVLVNWILHEQGFNNEFISH